MSETIHGACLCGQVTYDVREPEAMGFCHCTRCQRWSGGAGSVSVEVEVANFEITAGEELIRHFTEEGFTGVGFCTNCGSHIMAERVAQPVVLLRLGCLDTPVSDRPQVHIWRSDAAPWYDPKQQFPEKPEGLT